MNQGGEKLWGGLGCGDQYHVHKMKSMSDAQFFSKKSSVRFVSRKGESQSLGVVRVGKPTEWDDLMTCI